MTTITIPRETFDLMERALEEAEIEFEGETTQSGDGIAAAIRNMKENNV